MLESQRIEIERIKVQDRINSPRFTEIRQADEDFEVRMAERKVLQEQLAGLNERLIEAYQQEDQEAQAAMARNADTTGWTSELRELRNVAQRTSIADYVTSVVTEMPLHGAAKEYSEHVFGRWHPGDYPLEMLLDRDEFFEFKPDQWHDLKEADRQVEERTVITGVAGTHGNPTFVERILADGEAAYCRAIFPAVGPGRHSYPVVSGTTVAGTIARDTDETPAGGLTIVDADPDRIQHSYEYAAADELQIPGVANGLASDLRMSLMSGLDNKVIDHLQSTLTDTDLGAGTTLTTAILIQGVASVVDGRGARYFNEVRVLAGNTDAGSQTTAFERIGALLAGTTIDAVFNWMAAIRASGHMSAAAGGEDHIITIKTGGAAPRLIVPVWRRGTLLRDTGRLQLRGQITLTGVMYADVILANSELHNQFSVETQ